MKRLLVFHPFLATYRLDLYNYLSNKFIFKAIFYNPKIKNLGFKKEILNQHAKFDFRYLRNGVSIGTQIVNFGIIKWLITFKPDIVLPHEFGFNTIATIIFRKILRYKIFITCDDSPQIAENCKGLRKVFRTYCITRIEGLIAVNPTTISILQKKYPKTKCEFLFFPIIQDESSLQLKLKRSKSIARDYILEHDLKNKFIFIYVGRLSAVKGLDLLISAFSVIHKNNSNTKLIIVGEGAEKTSLIAKTASLNIQDAVLFTGQKLEEELYAWYKLSQVFVLPSRHEPFGAVVNEALVSGCYTIVSNQVGACCLINNKNGRIFESGNQMELIELMEQSILNFDKSDESIEKTNLMFTSFQQKVIELIDFISR